MRTRYLLVLIAIAAGCSADSVPRPRFPQLEGAREATESGGERYRAHQACVGATTSADGLITCMRQAGWDFVIRRPAYPEADCWTARDANDVPSILAQCFTRTPGAGRR